jgi:hypothetical protein
MIDFKIQEGQDTDGKVWYRYAEEGSKQYYLSGSLKSQRDAFSKAKLEGIGIEVKLGVWNGR